MEKRKIKKQKLHVTENVTCDDYMQITSSYNVFDYKIKDIKNHIQLKKVKMDKLNISPDIIVVGEEDELLASFYDAEKIIGVDQVGECFNLLSGSKIPDDGYNDIRSSRTLPPIVSYKMTSTKLKK